MTKEIKEQIISLLEEFQEVEKIRKEAQQLGIKIAIYSSFVELSMGLIDLLLDDKEDITMLDWWLFAKDQNIYAEDETTITHTLDTARTFVNYMLNEYRLQP